jgi:basic membrane lipoprotein Med (substrate-binding protein (PBP1-ABC) superfamily)
VSLIFNEQEGSYLVGALAGAMTKTNIVGFIGGMNVPLIKKFEYGYRAGVLTMNPRARVLTGYTGNWDDVNKGRELALTQFNQGADIIYHAAGRCGVGVIRARRAEGQGLLRHRRGQRPRPPRARARADQYDEARGQRRVRCVPAGGARAVPQRRRRVRREGKRRWA